MSLRDLCPLGIYVPWGFMSLGDLCPLGIYVPWGLMFLGDLCPLGTYVPYATWDIVSYGNIFGNISEYCLSRRLATPIWQGEMRMEIGKFPTPSSYYYSFFPGCFIYASSPFKKSCEKMKKGGEYGK
jgi:hypothetical protein